MTPQLEPEEETSVVVAPPEPVAERERAPNPVTLLLQDDEGKVFAAKSLRGVLVDGSGTEHRFRLPLASRIRFEDVAPGDATLRMLASNIAPAKHELHIRAHDPVQRIHVRPPSQVAVSVRFADDTLKSIADAAQETRDDYFRGAFWCQARTDAAEFSDPQFDERTYADWRPLRQFGVLDTIGHLERKTDEPLLLELHLFGEKVASTRLESNEYSAEFDLGDWASSLASLRFAVADARGGELGKVQLQFVRHEPEWRTHVRPDDEGEVILGALRPGRYTLHLTHGEHQHSQSVHLSPREHRDLGTLHLDASEGLALTVLGAGGQPVDGVIHVRHFEDRNGERTWLPVQDYFVFGDDSNVPTFDRPVFVSASNLMLVDECAALADTALPWTLLPPGDPSPTLTAPPYQEVELALTPPLEHFETLELRDGHGILIYTAGRETSPESLRLFHGSYSAQRLHRGEVRSSSAFKVDESTDRVEL